MFYVYVLQALEKEDRFYLGYTSEMERRIAEHNSGKSRYTKGTKWRVVYYEAYVSDAAARKRERRLKHDGRVRQFLMKRIKEDL